MVSINCANAAADVQHLIVNAAADVQHLIVIQRARPRAVRLR